MAEIILPFKAPFNGHSFAGEIVLAANGQVAELHMALPCPQKLFSGAKLATKLIHQGMPFEALLSCARAPGAFAALIEAAAARCVAAGIVFAADDLTGGELDRDADPDNAGDSMEAGF